MGRERWTTVLGAIALYCMLAVSSRAEVEEWVVVDGRAVSETGFGVAGAVVYAAGTDECESDLRKRLLAGEGVGRTDSMGYFKLRVRAEMGSDLVLVPERQAPRVLEGVLNRRGSIEIGKIELRSGIRIEGVVVNAHREPVGGLEVVCSSRSVAEWEEEGIELPSRATLGRFVRRARTGSDGRFRIEGWRRDEGYVWVDSTDDYVAAESPRQLEGGDNTQLVVKVNRLWSVVVAVRDGQSGDLVKAIGELEYGGVGEVPSQHGFEQFDESRNPIALRLIEGEYWVRVFCSGYEDKEERLVAGRDESQRDVALNRDPVNTWADLSVRAVCSQSGAVAPAALHAKRLDAGQRGGVVVSVLHEAGWLRGHVRPGEYAFTCSEAGWIGEPVVAQVKGKSVRVEVRVEKGGELVLVAKGGEKSGSSPEFGVTLVSPAVLRFRRASEPFSRLQVVRRGQTFQYGAGTVLSIPIGVYDLRVGLEREQKTVSVRAVVRWSERALLEVE